MLNIGLSANIKAQNNEIIQFFIVPLLQIT